MSLHYSVSLFFDTCFAFAEAHDKWDDLSGQNDMGMESDICELLGSLSLKGWSEEQHAAAIVSHSPSDSLRDLFLTRASGWQLVRDQTISFGIGLGL